MLLFFLPYPIHYFLVYLEISHILLVIFFSLYICNPYRKNPVHFQHFSHPGDSDYGGVQVMCQDLADDRPECPYGESCYRYGNLVGLVVLSVLLNLCYLFIYTCSFSSQAFNF